MNDHANDGAGAGAGGGDDAAAAAAASAAAAAAAAAPPSLDIDALLHDEAAADTPIKISDLKPFLEKHTESIVAKVSDDLRTARERDEQQRRANEENAASAKEDMDFASAIEAGLDSADEDVRTKARADREANTDRYKRGMALSWQRESQEHSRGIIEQHLAPLWQQIRAMGPEMAKLVDVDFKDRDFLAKYAESGQVNWLKATVERYGEVQYERGKTEAADEADRQRRANEGAEGAPSLNGGGGGGNGDDLWAGIDRSKPGAATEYNKRLAERNAKRGVGAAARR